MKLNVEIEIDWIDDQMTIDDIIKQEIITGITSRISEALEKEVKSKVEKDLDSRVIQKVDENTQAMFDEFISREVAITDKYGDTIKVWPSLKDLMKDRFDKFLEQKVDSDGKSYDGNYKTTTTRIYYMIYNQLKKFADKFTSDTVKTVSEEIRKHVELGLTNKLGSELMKVLKVDKMLKK